MPKTSDLMDLLRNNSAFWSKLGFCYDPPRFDENGKIICFFDDFDKQVERHRNFYNAGIKIHTSILFSGWVGIDTYDYELIDRVLNAIFSCGEDLLYIPRIKLNPPLDWCKANPKDLLVYEDGPREAEEILSLVGGPRHDILGYESADGYQNTGAWKDDRPNVGGLISNQSFSSQKWLHDAGEALKRIIRHIEDGPYADRVVAYHIAYGVCGESVVWGRFSQMRGDYGISNRRNFYSWAVEKYGSAEGLEQAWNMCDVNIDNIQIPTVAHREGDGKSIRSFFRGDQDDQICVDYDEFTSSVNANAIEHFGRVVKNESGGKPVGAFYGYIMEVHNVAYTGHLNIERLLNSPYVDFLAGPKSYYRCHPGEPGGEMVPALSINRRKLWMDELDNGTHLGDFARFSNMSETKQLMWREVAKNISHNSNFWWMDLLGGWYDSPEILAEIRKIEDVVSNIRERPHASMAEVLFVVDEESLYHIPSNFVLFNTLMRETVRELQLCGTLVDSCLLSDIGSFPMGKYKFIIFLNAFKLEDAQWQKINMLLPRNATLLWYIAPGILAPEYCVDHVADICGVSIGECGIDRSLDNQLVPCGNLDGTPVMNWPKMNVPKHSGCNEYPVFEVAGCDQILARYANGKVGIAQTVKDWRVNIYAALPLLRNEHLRWLMENAGCHMMAPRGVSVYGDQRFFGLFSSDEVHGKLSLPEKCNLREVMTDELLKKTDLVHLEMNACDTRFFLIEPEKEIMTTGQKEDLLF